MKLIEAIIRPTIFPEVKAALEQIGVEEIMESEVVSHGGKKQTFSYRGAHCAIDFIEKTKIEVVAADALVSRVVKTIRSIAGTDCRDDCRIFILTSVEIPCS